MRRQVAVHLSCLMCASYERLVVDDVRTLKLPGRCTRCAGSIVANEVEVLPAPKPVGALDWSDDKPKRGRPLGSKNKPKVAA